MEKKKINITTTTYDNGIKSRMGHKRILISPSHCTLDTKEEIYKIIFKKVIKPNIKSIGDLMTECTQNSDLKLQLNKNKTIGILSRRVLMSVDTIIQLGSIMKFPLPNFINELDLK